jgi:MFS family permease
MPDPNRPANRPTDTRSAAVTLQIVSFVMFTFLCYLSIGIPLAVLPRYVHTDLGYGSVWAGAAISVQYLATLLTRPLAGRMTDTVGPKKTVQRGLLACAASGALLVGAALVPGIPVLSIVLLVISRLALGLGESCCGTGSIMWGLGRVGASHNASVISWNGIATYSALAIGAPLGVTLAQSFGVVSLGVVVMTLAMLGYALAWKRQPAPVVQGERLPFSSVFGRVLPHGIGLALGSIGFGAIATFVTLFYASRHWPHAALSLTVFGTLFVGARLLFANAIKTHGGFRVAIVSFVVECAGLVLLWQAPIPQLAMAGAALSGFGFALVFPALGVEAVGLAPPASRGAALSAYSLFLDLSLGITGPLAGLIAGDFGYASVYLFAALAAAAAALLTVTLYMLSRRGGATAST